MDTLKEKIVEMDYDVLGFTTSVINSEASEVKVCKPIAASTEERYDKIDGTIEKGKNGK